MKKITSWTTGVMTALVLTASVRAQINFQVIHEFDGLNGANAPGHLIYQDGLLYGMTAGDTGGNHGVIFSILPDGSDFTLLHRFTGQPGDGAWPHGSLSFFNNRLYGLTWAGGCDDSNCPENLDENGCGSAFSLQTGGDDYTVFWEFACGEGDVNAALPNAYFISDGDKLYSTTQVGGDYRDGTVFSINPDGTEFTVLHSFNGNENEGRYPAAGLVLDGGTLYGTISMDGLSSDDDGGIIFSIQTDGTYFTILHMFNKTDGKMPFSAPTIAGGRIFGTTSHRGDGENGVVFSINKDGTDYRVLHYFTPDEGCPMEGVVMA